MIKTIKDISEDLWVEIRPQVLFVEITGSIRRKSEIPNDIDFVIIPMPDVEIKLKDSIGKNWEGSYKVQHVLSSGIKVDFMFTTKENLGACMMHFTGPKWFNIKMRSIAKSKGMKLNEYGLYNAQGEKIAGKSEQEIFEKLEKEFKLPEDRK